MGRKTGRHAGGGLSQHGGMIPGAGCRCGTRTGNRNYRKSVRSRTVLDRSSVPRGAGSRETGNPVFRMLPVQNISTLWCSAWTLAGG